MHNKKILILICLLFPLTSYAAWWNPTTWEIFKWKISIEKPKEVVVQNQATITPVVVVEATTTIATSSFKAYSSGTPKKITPASQTIKQQNIEIKKDVIANKNIKNFNDLPIGIAGRMIPLFDEHIAVLNQYEHLANERLSRSMQIKDLARTLFDASKPDGDDKLNDIGRGMYKIRIEEIESIRDTLINPIAQRKSNFEQNKRKLISLIGEWQSKQLNKEDALFIANDLNRFYEVMIVSDISKAFENYSEYSRELEDAHSRSVAYLKNGYNAILSSNQQRPTSTLPPASSFVFPKIEMPKITRCNTRWDGIQYQTICNETSY